MSGGRIWIDPEIGLVLVFLTNRWQADRGPEIDVIRGVYEALGQGQGLSPSSLANDASRARHSAT